MAVIKCKMCGGDVELATDKTFGTCEFCGSTMTFPKVADEQRATAFNRGNHFRRIGEFDKALQVYERIVREDDTDAEAHWCCALCRFGIEYVEDPTTYEWIPTCHRASFDSFLDDVDYLAAVEHSEGITRRQYQKDAAKIAEVQRSILSTSQNEEPYDVFICYKESDEHGNRTRDSILAQDIYYQLTEQGKKVFFARITLENVIGKQYEPYIFAALNSAKVMIVVGTRPEHLSSVWVKNEWSRFLAMMKKDHSKLLLPCYRDMDPYDMPEQLSVLQSYDMGKIGFIQDLIRGVNKVLDADKKTEAVRKSVPSAPVMNGNTLALLDRGYMALEDGEWVKADGFFEEVLNQDARCADAYVGKLLAEVQTSSIEGLKDCGKSLNKSTNYQRAIRFGSKELVEKIQVYTVDNKGALLKRAFIFLEDGDWIRANEYAEKLLDEDPENGQAYLVKLLSEYRTTSIEELGERGYFIDKSANYHKVQRFGDESLTATLRRIVEDYKRKESLKKCVEIYEKAINKAEEYKSDFFSLDLRIRCINEAIKDLESISQYRDAAQKAEEYREYLKSIQNTKSGGCYIATCVYGSYDCPQVWTLRRFRDHTLATSWYGRAFIRAYYAISPTLVKWFGNTTWFRKLWKGTLDHMVYDLQQAGVESTPYQDKTW